MGIIFRLWLCQKKEFLLVKNFYLSGDSDRRWVSCSYFFGEFLKVVSVPTIYSIFLAWILLGMSLFIIVNVYLYSLQKKKKKIRYVFISYFILFLIEQNVSNEPMHAIQIYASFGWTKYWIYISSLNSFKSLFETLFLEQAIP